MSSLWTPEGEYRVPRPDDRAPSPSTAPGTPADSGGPGSAPPADAAIGSELAGDRAGSLTGSGGAQDQESAELAEELAALERSLLEAPASDVVANHCYGLFQLAALHLGARSPHLEDARLAIDALGSVVEALGPRLGDASESLADGLARIRIAYVQIAGTIGADGTPPAA